MAARLKLGTLSAAELAKLKSDLSFTPKPRGYNNYKNYAYSGSAQTLLAFQIDSGWIRIPRPYALKYFPSRLVENNFRVNSTFQFTNQLYQVQEPIVAAAWQSLAKLNSIILALYTGFGKTIVATYLASLCQSLVIVFVDGITIIEQWRKVFKDFTNAQVWVVGESPPPQANVVICMNTRFDQLPFEYKMKIGVVIVDEGHCFATPSRLPLLLGLEPKYIIIATATPDRTDGLFSVIETFGGWNKIVKISTKPFNVLRYNTGVDVPIKLNKQGKPDWSALTRELCQDPTRNQLILDIVRMNNQRNFKILILTWRSDHVNYLHDCVAQMNISVDKMNSNKRSYHDSAVLVGTIAKIGKAFDEKNVCDDFNGIRLDLLLLVGSMRSVILLEQVAGRVFRAVFPNIIHFCDKNNISRNHWNQASKWYVSRMGRISESDSPLVKQSKNDAITNQTRAVNQSQLTSATKLKLIVSPRPVDQLSSSNNSLTSCQISSNNVDRAQQQLTAYRQRLQNKIN